MSLSRRKSEFSFSCETALEHPMKGLRRRRPGLLSLKSALITLRKKTSGCRMKGLRLVALPSPSKTQALVQMMSKC